MEECMNTPDELSLFLGDTEVRYLLYEGNDPTIILLHAVGFNPWLWHPIARELAGRHRIVAPFFCDHRTADPEKGGLPWPLLADDFVSLCRRLEIEKPIIVGHSIGGAVSILSHGIVPDLARKLILIEPVVFPEADYGIVPTLATRPVAARAVKRRNGWENRREAEAYFRSRPLFQTWEDEMIQLYLSHGLKSDNDERLTLTCSPSTEAALYLGELARDPWPLLPDISCPVLVLEGETSMVGRIMDFEKIARRFPNGTYQLVQSAGHLIPMEKPREVLGSHTGFSVETEVRYNITRQSLNRK